MPGTAFIEPGWMLPVRGSAQLCELSAVEVNVCPSGLSTCLLAAIKRRIAARNLAARLDGGRFIAELYCGMGAVIMIASGPLQTGSAVASDVRTMTRAPAGGGHGGLTLAGCSCASGCATAASAESKNPAAIPRITMRSLVLLLLYVFLPRDYAFRNDRLRGFNYKR